MADLFDRFRPRAVVHFAAESHVDRSISGPQVFVDTNVRGTTVLLGVAHRYWLTLDDEEKAAFRFINISTDEVYGSMTVDTPPNTEATPFDPSSPYSASKAAADQLHLDIDKKKMVLTDPIRSLGTFEVPIKLHKDVTAKLRVKVTEA